MRAEAVSWDDWSAVNAAPIVEEDKWHVAIAPGEVKVVSLEQLDDLFRLSIVDSEAMVWQNGMSEWQPLRVIAGLDDEPAPAPKRTHPRPPSPPSRSAPPPPRPAPIASAPYAQPIITQQAFAAQIAPVVPIRPTTSVRPLVVSAPPPRASSGGGFGRFIVGLALLAGVGVTAYRNGFLREGAHAAHQDALYARLETALGGPAFGTLREIEEALPHAEGASAASLSGDALARDAAPSTSPEVTLNAAKPSEPSHEAAPVAPSGVTPPVVSLESLRPEKPGAKAEQPIAAAAAPAPAPQKAAPAAQFAAAPVAKAVAPKAAPVAVAKAAPPAPKPAAAPAPEKPSGPMSEREKLNAAIGASMMSSPPTSKKKAKGSEYDPLNPNL